MYFEFPYTTDSLKKQYRTLSKKLHPDTGGNEGEFNLMKYEYDVLTKLVDNQKMKVRVPKKKKKKVFKKVSPGMIVQMQIKNEILKSLDKIFKKKLF